MSQDSDEMLHDRLMAKRDSITDSSTDIRDIDVPCENYPVLCELPNGDREYLCMHCKVGYKATEVDNAD